MDYPEFNKRIGEKIAILTFSGITKCATEAFKFFSQKSYVHIFNFPRNPQIQNLPSFFLFHSQKQNFMAFPWIRRQSMADSQLDSNAFSVRIVSIDHYMAPPIHGLDISYSTFQGTLYFHSQTTPFNSFFIYCNLFICLILGIEFSIEKKVKLISQFSKYILWIFTLFFFGQNYQVEILSTFSKLSF